MTNQDDINPKLVSFIYENGETNMAMKHPVVATIAAEMARYFIEEHGINYVQARMFDGESQRTYVLTVSLDEKPLPSDIVTAYRTVLQSIAKARTAKEASRLAVEALKQFGHLGT